MEWYYVVLIILGCLNLGQMFVLNQFRVQKQLVDERHTNLVDRVDKAERALDRLKSMTLNIDAYLRYSPNEDYSDK